MSEHYCNQCNKGKGDTCTLTGATHRTGIECPSFGQKEVEMFKMGDRVRVVADEARLTAISVHNNPTEGCIKQYATFDTSLPWEVDVGLRSWWFAAEDLELIEPAVLATTEGEPWNGGSSQEPPIRTFESGATRDTDQGKLDYLKALSPIVLRRFVQYMHGHNLMSDGSLRDVGDWKRGQPQKVYHHSKGRHFFTTWLLEEGYHVEDNHGEVTEEDALCGEMFNAMGKLHEILKAKITTGEADVAG